MKRWQPCCFHRVPTAFTGSLVNPWLALNSGSPKKRRGRPGSTRRTWVTWRFPSPGLTWRPGSSSLGFLETFHQDWWGFHWRTSTHTISRTKEWVITALILSMYLYHLDCPFRLFRSVVQMYLECKEYDLSKGNCQ